MWLSNSLLWCAQSFNAGHQILTPEFYHFLCVQIMVVVIIALPSFWSKTSVSFFWIGLGWLLKRNSFKRWCAM